MILLETIPCPLCQGQEFMELNNTRKDTHIKKYGKIFEGKTRSIWKNCKICGFVFQNPRPSQKAIDTFYLKAEYHDRTQIKKDEYLKWSPRYLEEKVNYAIKVSGLKKGKVFDIGCGRGGMLYLFKKKGWDCYGVEPDKNQFEFASKELELENLINGIFDKNFELNEKVDLVISDHAFEHFSDLKSVMEGIKKILKPEGVIVTFVPTYYKNRSSISKLWMNSSHYSLFTHKTLDYLFGEHGIAEINHTYRGWKKEIDDLWHSGRNSNMKVDVERFKVKGEKVRFYINVLNPLNSFLWYPVYSHFEKRARAYNIITLFFQSPVSFFSKLKVKILSLKLKPN